MRAFPAMLCLVKKILDKKRAFPAILSLFKRI